MKKSENRNNKKLRSVIIILILLIILIWIVYDFTPIAKVHLANKIYGTSKCTKYNSEKLANSFELMGDKDHSTIGGTSITPWKCSLCYRKGKSGTTITPKLCNLCAILTNRCNQCGKLKE